MKLLAAFAMLNLLSACSSAPAQTENAAEHYCHERGGSVTFEKQLFGETGYCLLPDGTKVERWRFYLKNRVLP